MASKVSLYRGPRFVGELTFYDAPLSIDALKLAIPEAVWIAVDFRSGNYTVNVEDQEPLRIVQRGGKNAGRD